jgi:hypothetical protein
VLCLGPQDARRNSPGLNLGSFEVCTRTLNIAALQVNVAAIKEEPGQRLRLIDEARFCLNERPQRISATTRPHVQQSLLRAHQSTKLISQISMLQRLLTSAKAIVDTATLGLDVREAQLDPSLNLVDGVAFECLQEEGAGTAVSTRLTLDEGATMKLSRRQHPIMMT